jgi:hypothetical protein
MDKILPVITENLDTSLDEDQILESLSRLRLEIFRIETTTGPSRRTVCIGEEIQRLEMQLALCKDQAKAQAKLR